ncbi:hypothetical protein BDQ17DRAFT_1435227 [Cyathus striatus]|nr:hypothetical protein BDQ17DRAFT_1435227 [Cyathus striatus]
MYGACSATPVFDTSRPPNGHNDIFPPSPTFLSSPPPLPSSPLLLSPPLPSSPLLLSPPLPSSPLLSPPPLPSSPLLSPPPLPSSPLLSPPPPLLSSSSPLLLLSSPLFLFPPSQLQQDDNDNEGTTMTQATKG